MSNDITLTMKSSVGVSKNGKHTEVPAQLTSTFIGPDIFSACKTNYEYRYVSIKFYFLNML